jgi:hypothetical protein
MKPYLKYFTMTVALAVILVTAGCSRESTRQEPVTTQTEQGSSTAPPAEEVRNRDRALVRVVHAIPGGGVVDVFADDSKVFTNINYKTITPYKEMAAERFTFRVRPAGQNVTQPLAENGENLYSGNHYTVIALPGNAGESPSLRVLSDNLTPPSSGKAKIRVIHSSPDAGEVDIYARDKTDALFSGVNFGSETAYTEVDPMAATLEVRPEGKKMPVLTRLNTNFEAGKHYTVIVTGRAKGQPGLEAMVIEDQLVGQMRTSD